MRTHQRTIRPAQRRAGFVSFVAVSGARMQGSAGRQAASTNLSINRTSSWGSAFR